MTEVMLVETSCEPCAEAAQLEIRRYAEACELFLAEKMPITHAAFVANERTAP